MKIIKRGIIARPDGLPFAMSHPTGRFGTKSKTASTEPSVRRSAIRRARQSRENFAASGSTANTSATSRN